MRKFRLYSIACIIAVLAAGETHGENGKPAADSIPLYRMKEIVVTAKRIPMPVEDLALSVSIIGKDEVQATTSNSSTDLAGVLPGIFIERTGDFGRSDVNIRGLGSSGRFSLVLVNGRPEKMALFDCTVTHSFPLHDLERIEVVRGASSMLYGSGAMGGVMNVIPRRIRNDVEIDLKAAGGSHDTWIAGGRLGGRKGPLSGSISIDHRESKGHIEHSAYHGTDIHAGGDLGLGDRITVSVFGKYFDGYKEEPALFTNDPATATNAWNDYERGSFDIHLKGETDVRSLDVRYYRNFGEHRFWDGWHSLDATDGVMVHASAAPIHNMKLNAGVDYRYQQGEFPDTDGAEWNKWETGIYLETTYRFGDLIILSAGARYNRDEVAGGETSPSFGIVWQPTGGTSIRCLASHGFRSPQLNELYMFPSSNDSLQAERVWNYEIGLRRELFGRMVLDIAAFRMEGADMIDLVSTSQPPPMFIYRNTGEFEFHGIETSLSGSLESGLGGRISYSWLDPGDWTRGRPGRKFDLMLEYSRSRFTFRVDAQRVEDYFAGNGHADPIDPYTVINLYGESAIVSGGRIFAGVKNLFDERYVIYVDLPGGAAGLYEMPGITFITGIKYAY